MLVVSRKKDESIILKVPGHKDITITVVRVDNQNKVRLGIEAEQDVLVLREELDENPKPSTNRSTNRLLHAFA
jgi:carbon storage regulator CsrA